MGAEGPRILYPPPWGGGRGWGTIKKVTIYTDGACSRNPGSGGYGAILIFNGVEKELSGGEPDTTNNRMELTAAITALEALKETCEVELYSDSQYVVNGISKGWAAAWKKNGWRKSDKEPALNIDLWERLLDLTAKHRVKFIWVKGHADNEYNERCDRMASAESAKYNPARTCPPPRSTPTNRNSSGTPG